LNLIKFRPDFLFTLIISMAFFVNTLKNFNKKVKHYLNPNENPTDYDRYAFKLLDNLNV
jgi:hypothetical protein